MEGLRWQPFGLLAMLGLFTYQLPGGIHTVRKLLLLLLVNTEALASLMELERNLEGVFQVP